MKKLTLLFFLFSILLGYSQNNPTTTQAQDWNSSRSNKTSKTSRVSNPNNSNPLKRKDISNNINIGIAYGLSVPSSSFKDKTYAGQGSYFELSGAYYFSKIGLGLSIGQISNPTDNNLSDFTGNLGFPVSNNSENIKSTYVGIGPEYKLKLNKFETIFQIRAGMYAVKSFAIGGDNIENPDVSIPFLSLNSEKATTLGFVSTSVKFDYNINHNLSLFASAGYLTALSDQLIITESKIEDINNNGIIDQEDFKTENGNIRYSITEKNSKPSSLNLGFGISYNFDLSTKKYGSDGNNNIPIEKNKVKEVIKKKEAVKNSINPQNPQVNDGNTQNQTAKKKCIKSGGVFWENADGSDSCKTTITKSPKSIKIPGTLANELATAKKMALADKTQQGVIEITVVYPNKNKITMVSIPAQKTQDAETILQQLIEATQGHGDDNGKVRTKYRPMF